LKKDVSALHVTNLTDPVDRTLSDIPAYKIYFVSPLFGGLQTSEIIAIKDGKVYTISYQAKLETFEKYFDQFQKMVDSFQLVDISAISEVSAFMSLFARYIT